MAERLVPVTLFMQTLLSGTTTSAIQSSAVYLGRDTLGADSLMYALSSVVSTPDCAFFYAISPDNVTFGSFADNTALLTSTFSGGNPQGWHGLAMPTLLGPYVKFAVSGTGSNPTDCRVTATLFLRMS